MLAEALKMATTIASKSPVGMLNAVIKVQCVGMYLCVWGDLRKESCSWSFPLSSIFAVSICLFFDLPPPINIDHALILFYLAIHLFPLPGSAVAGTKVNLLYARDHSVEEGLRYIRTWNSAMLQTKDLAAAVQATMAKQKPVFAKL